MDFYDTDQMYATAAAIDGIGGDDAGIAAAASEHDILVASTGLSDFFNFAANTAAAGDGGGTALQNNGGFANAAAAEGISDEPVTAAAGEGPFVYIPLVLMATVLIAIAAGLAGRGLARWGRRRRENGRARARKEAEATRLCQVVCEYNPALDESAADVASQ